MSKTALSMGTFPLWEGVVSFDFLPDGTREDPQRDRTRFDVGIHTHDRWKHTFSRSPPQCKSEGNRRK